MNNARARSLSHAEKIDWLRLIRSENVGPVTFRALLARFGSATNAIAALPDLARHGGRGRAIKVCLAEDAEREMEKLDALGAHLVAWGEAAYPPRLAHIEDAPPLITVLGDIGLLKKQMIAVVGARNASINGKRFAERLSADLGGGDGGSGGLAVASGMARGIDGAAHTGALATGTVAVLGGGVDVIYPKENAALYEEIKTRGAIIAESPLGTKPQARHFPRRNRIISGLSRGVVVVEAGLRSGSLITARMALEQGREVFAVPGSPLDPRSRGTNHLLRQGAALTESAEDIFTALAEAPGGSSFMSEALDFKAPPPITASLEVGDSARQEIEENLGTAPLVVDELVRNSQFSPAVVSMILLEMELAGRLERHPGNQVSKIERP